MMGSPMVLIFILPLLALEYVFTGIGSLLGIDTEALNALLGSVDWENAFKSETIVQAFAPVLEFFAQFLS
ncbi:MAG: hypothetical protein IK955_07265 [Clostridia bacterium]|nr:hypothetical protein [Clostridia bacterium]